MQQRLPSGGARTTRRYGLNNLPGLAERDGALADHGLPPMGDLSEALTDAP